MSIALKKNFNLTINGQLRPVTGWKYMNGSGYSVQVPAKQLVDNSPFGENPSVQGHVAKFDNNGNLLGVTALGWNAESGFYNTQWPSKQDSVYNANAAKQYAPQLFKAFQNLPTEYIKEEKCGGKVKKGENGIKTQQTTPERENWPVAKTKVQTLPAQGKYIPALRDSMVYYTRPDGGEYFVEYIDGKPFYEDDVRNGVGRGINHDLNSNKSDTTYYNWSVPVNWELTQEDLKRAYSGSPQPRYQYIKGKKQGGRLMRQGGKIIEVPFEK